MTNARVIVTAGSEKERKKRCEKLREISYQDGVNWKWVPVLVHNKKHIGIKL